MAYISKNPFTQEVLKEYSPHDQTKINESLDTAEALLTSDWSSFNHKP